MGLKTEGAKSKTGHPYSSKEMVPLPSWSKTLNALFSSASTSTSFMGVVIILQNSCKTVSKLLGRIHKWDEDTPSKSMVPLLSESTSLIMSSISASVGFWPRDLMTVPSSSVEMVPVKEVRSLHPKFSQRSNNTTSICVLKRDCQLCATHNKFHQLTKSVKACLYASISSAVGGACQHTPQSVKS